jgi:diguanylate cyclase
MIGSLSALVDQLLGVMEAEAAHDEKPKAQEFRGQIQQFRAELAAATDREQVARSGSACVGACRQYLDSRRSETTKREAGLRDVVRVLGDGLANIAAEAGSFTANLTSASHRVGALAGLDDIRQLKNRLTQEVGEIKRVVVEKQRRDEVLHASLADRIDALETTLAVTRVAASMDPLTRVAHRGHFDAMLQRWVENCHGTKNSFILVLIDVDGFKSINDTHGHPAGDLALVEAAKLLTTAIRPCDLVARYGGDEFALLLANMTLAQAEERMPQIIARFAHAEFRCDAANEPQRLKFTVSCGIAQFGRNDTPESLLKRADEALYAAKQQGRNRVVAKRVSVW